MRVLIVSAVFPPEPVVSAQTSEQLARWLVGKGHEVEVVTNFPNRPGGKLYDGFKQNFVKRYLDANGYRVTRCFTFLSNESQKLSRLLENISFGLISAWAVFWTKKPSVIYSNTWPIFATGLLFLVAKLRRIPLVISIQDIYPDSLVAQQRIQKGTLLEHWLRWVDGVIARGSKFVILISDRFMQIYRDRRLVNPDQLFVVPNWVDGNAIDIDVQTNGFRNLNNIPPDGFIVTYGGNIGKAANVETVIEAFGFLRDRKDLFLIVAGEGSHLSNCQKIAGEISSNNIIFYHPWLAKETSIVLCSANLLVLPTQSSQSLFSVPSKLISYMLAGKPIIALTLVQSDIANMIIQAKCGWVIAPDDPEGIADKIREIAEMDPQELASIGLDGRVFALSKLTEKVNLPKVIDILEEAGR